MRRGLDSSRPVPISIAPARTLGISAGAGGVFVTALESRYRAVVFSGTGISSRAQASPRRQPMNFVSRITAPKLMLHAATMRTRR